MTALRSYALRLPLEADAAAAVALMVVGMALLLIAMFLDEVAP